MTLYVEVCGTGPAVLLLHGWPHSAAMWRRVADALATEFTVVVPDLPGIGGSPAPPAYDAAAISGLLDDMMAGRGHRDYAVVATDASVPAAVLAGLEHPERMRGLAVFEGTMPGVSGAEEFFAAGAPWWFGFHSLAEFPERVLAGHEAEYVRFFLDVGTVTDVDAATLDAIVSAYADGALGRSFGYYRAMTTSGQQLATASARRRLTVPTLALGARPVGNALARQLVGFTDDLLARAIPDSGHIIALDAPDALLAHLVPFLRRTAGR